MSIAEFCEREYESNFNHQIEKLDNFVWTPGQIDEHFLGFDAAFFSSAWRIFRFFDYPFPYPRGIHASLETWQEFFEFTNHRFQNFKFNLFVQHKRPEYIRSSRGKERSHWNDPYFRYTINSNQQAQLEKLENIADTDALVTYACPAFHTFQELWDHSQNSTLVQTSNFVRPISLVGHGRYSFIEPGCNGCATSEPEIIEGQDFKERLMEHLDVSGGFSLNEIIKRAAEIVQEAIRKSGVPDQFFQKVLSDITTDRIKKDSVLYSYITVQAFCFQNRTSWSIVGNKPK